MPSNSAEYQRAYRARRKAEHEAYDLMKPTIGAIKKSCQERIAELEAEVKRLKQELAKRGGPVGLAAPVMIGERGPERFQPSFGTSRPAPKGR